MKRAPDAKDTDHVYYQIKDSNGAKSIIHNSGKLNGLYKLPVSFQILKNEVNDGKTINLSKPIAIYLGTDSNRLSRVINLDDVKEDDLCYYIDVNPRLNNRLV